MVFFNFFEYQVNIGCFDFLPTSELCCKILNKVCLQAAQVFNCQTGREYGFRKFCLLNPPHASEVNFITNEDLDGVLTNNLESERHLAGFRKQVAVAKFRNQRFSKRDKKLLFIT